MGSRKIHKTHTFISKENLKSIEVHHDKIVIEWLVDPEGNPLDEGDTQKQTIILKTNYVYKYTLRDYDSEY